MEERGEERKTVDSLGYYGFRQEKKTLGLKLRRRREKKNRIENFLRINEEF